MVREVIFEIFQALAVLGVDPLDDVGQRADPAIYRIEPAIYRIEPVIDRVEPVIDCVESAIDVAKSTFHVVDSANDLREPEAHLLESRFHRCRQTRDVVLKPIDSLFNRVEARARRLSDESAVAFSRGSSPS